MKTPGSQRSAFSLVEVALALGVAAFALVAIFGLLPVGINTNTTSVQQTVATNLAAGIIADMREAPTAAALKASKIPSGSPRYGIDVTQSSSSPLYLDISGAKKSTALQANYQVTWTLTAPTGAYRTATYGSIVVSWPAGITPPAGSVTSFVALDRN